MQSQSLISRNDTCQCLTPSKVGTKNVFLCSSERGCVHQLAYRPSVQHVIDRTNGCRGWGMSQGSDVHIVPLTHLGIVERVDQVRNKGRQMGLDGVDASCNAKSVPGSGYPKTPTLTFRHRPQG